MIGKIILLILALALLAFASWFLYQNLPGEQEQFQIQETEIRGTEQETQKPVIEYGKIKQFYPNMRFSHNQMSYFIEPSCDEDRESKMQEAFFVLHNKTTIISFFSTTKEQADILVGCSEDYLEQEENQFIAGEGGPTKIINTPLYNIILNGKILLYRKSECDFPVIELHELLHVFGFDHSQNPKNIMYNFSSCDQDIDQDTIDTLISLYSTEALADLYISKINATKKGRYLDFEIEVKNQGLADAKNTTFVISSDAEEIDTFYLEDIEIGAGKILRVQNFKLPSRSTENIKFTIDKNNDIKEINEANNNKELSVT